MFVVALVLLMGAPGWSERGVGCGGGVCIGNQKTNHETNQPTTRPPNQRTNPGFQIDEEGKLWEHSAVSILLEALSDGFIGRFINWGRSHHQQLRHHVTDRDDVEEGEGRLSSSTAYGGRGSRWGFVEDFEAGVGQGVKLR